MKVKCMKLLDIHGNVKTSSDSLTIGLTYVVLEIFCDQDNGISYRLITDSKDQSPVIFKAIQFEIINVNQPSNWVTNINEAGFIDIGPSAWQKPYFWENCYDGDLAALEIYKREAAIIMEEERE